MCLCFGIHFRYISNPVQEANHTLHVAKVLGLNVDDKEDFLVSTFANLEASDHQRYQKLLKSM